MVTKFLTLMGTFAFLIALCFDSMAQTEAEMFTAKSVVFVELGG